MQWTIGPPADGSGAGLPEPLSPHQGDLDQVKPAGIILSPFLRLAGLAAHGGSPSQDTPLQKLDYHTQYTFYGGVLVKFDAPDQYSTVCTVPEFMVYFVDVVYRNMSKQFDIAPVENGKVLLSGLFERFETMENVPTGLRKELCLAALKATKEHGNECEVTVMDYREHELLQTLGDDFTKSSVTEGFLGDSLYFIPTVAYTERIRQQDKKKRIRQFKDCIMCWWLSLMYVKNGEHHIHQPFIGHVRARAMARQLIDMMQTLDEETFRTKSISVNGTATRVQWGVGIQTLLGKNIGRTQTDGHTARVEDPVEDPVDDATAAAAAAPGRVNVPMLIEFT
tara:strand:- start:56 stop:1066 length:1011 start_codon:yes stop_codon:yes gene_type:complete